MKLARLFCAAMMLPAFAAIAQAQDVRLGNLVIEAPWTRATPGGSKVGVGFLAIVNIGDSADTLKAASSPIAERVEIHKTTMANGIMRMQHLDDGLAIKPQEVTELRPGGLHLMLIGLKQPIKKGETLPLQLVFEKAGAANVTLMAAGIGAAQPPERPDLNKATGSNSGASGSASGAPSGATSGNTQESQSGTQGSNTQGSNTQGSN